MIRQILNILQILILCSCVTSANPDSEIPTCRPYPLGEGDLFVSALRSLGSESLVSIRTRSGPLRYELLDSGYRRIEEVAPLKGNAELVWIRGEEALVLEDGRISFQTGGIVRWSWPFDAWPMQVRQLEQGFALVSRNQGRHQWAQVNKAGLGAVVSADAIELVTREKAFTQEGDNIFLIVSGGKPREVARLKEVETWHAATTTKGQLLAVVTGSSVVGDARLHIITEDGSASLPIALEDWNVGSVHVTARGHIYLHAWLSEEGGLFQVEGGALVKRMPLSPNDRVWALTDQPTLSLVVSRPGRHFNMVSLCTN